MIYDILVEIMSNPGEKLNMYRDDIFTKICNMFTLCNKNLRYITKDNEKNKKLMSEFIVFLINNTQLDFGQLQLLEEILDSEKTTYSHKKVIMYHLELIKIHGRSHVFLETLIQITDKKIEGNLKLKEEILDCLFSDDQF
jgi:RIH domain